MGLAGRFLIKKPGEGISIFSAMLRVTLYFDSNSKFEFRFFFLTNLNFPKSYE